MPINRTEAEALIQEQVVNTIFQDVPKQSVFLSMARKLPNMTSKQTRIPVLDMLPMAYWVNGDTGHKQTSQQVGIMSILPPRSWPSSCRSRRRCSTMQALISSARSRRASTRQSDSVWTAPRSLASTALRVAKRHHHAGPAGREQRVRRHHLRHPAGCGRSFFKD